MGKKETQLIVIIGILAIIATIGYAFSNVYDAVTITDGEKLVVAGFIDEYNYESEPEKDKSMRAYVIVILLKVKNEYYNSIENHTTSQYEDVEASEWYSGYLGHAEKLGWLNGQGNFNPRSSVSTKFVKELVLQQLGYETKDINNNEIIDSLGIRIDAKDEFNMTTGEVYSAIWSMLNTPKKGTNIELGKILKSDFIVEKKDE